MLGAHSCSANVCQLFVLKANDLYLKCQIIIIRLSAYTSQVFCELLLFQKEGSKTYRGRLLQTLRSAFPSWSWRVKSANKCVQMEGLFVVLSSPAMWNKNKNKTKKQPRKELMMWACLCQDALTEITVTFKEHNDAPFLFNFIVCPNWVLQVKIEFPR